MDMDAQELLAELQALAANPMIALPRVRELAAAMEPAMASDRHSKTGIAAALTHQAVDYLCEGIEREQNTPEINRRFALAIKRAEAWVAAKENTVIFRPADES